MQEGRQVFQMAGVGMQVCWLVKTAGVSKQACWSVNQPWQVCRYVIRSYSWGMCANMLVGQMAWVGLGGMLVSQMAGVVRYVGWSKQLGMYAGMLADRNS